MTELTSQSCGENQMNKRVQRDFSKGWGWDKCSNESMVNISNSVV